MKLIWCPLQDEDPLKQFLIRQHKIFLAVCSVNHLAVGSLELFSEVYWHESSLYYDFACYGRFFFAFVWSCISQADFIQRLYFLCWLVYVQLMSSVVFSYSATFSRHTEVGTYVLFFTFLFFLKYCLIEQQCSFQLLCCPKSIFTLKMVVELNNYSSCKCTNITFHLHCAISSWWGSCPRSVIFMLERSVQEDWLKMVLTNGSCSTKKIQNTSEKQL